MVATLLKQAGTMVMNVNRKNWLVKQRGGDCEQRVRWNICSELEWTKDPCELQMDLLCFLRIQMRVKLGTHERVRWWRVNRGWTEGALINEGSNTQPST